MLNVALVIGRHGEKRHSRQKLDTGLALFSPSLDTATTATAAATMSLRTAAGGEHHHQSIAEVVAPILMLNPSYCQAYSNSRDPHHSLRHRQTSDCYLLLLLLHQVYRSMVSVLILVLLSMLYSLLEILQDRPY